MLNGLLNEFLLLIPVQKRSHSDGALRADNPGAATADAGNGVKAGGIRWIAAHAHTADLCRTGRQALDSRKIQGFSKTTRTAAIYPGAVYRAGWK